MPKKTKFVCLILPIMIILSISYQDLQQLFEIAIHNLSYQLLFNTVEFVISQIFDKRKKTRSEILKEFLIMVTSHIFGQYIVNIIGETFFDQIIESFLQEAIETFIKNIFNNTNKNS